MQVDSMPLGLVLLDAAEIPLYTTSNAAILPGSHGVVIVSTVDLMLHIVPGDVWLRQIEYLIKCPLPTFDSK